MRPAQYFSAEYLEQCRGASAERVLEYLDAFRQLRAPASPTRLVSLRIEESPLASFRRHCELEGVRYRTQIKVLMRKWLE